MKETYLHSAMLAGDIIKVLQQENIRGIVLFADNIEILKEIPDNSINLIYVDPPFNTGKKQTKNTIKAEISKNEQGRVGFKNKRYKTEILDTKYFYDKFDDYISFIEPRLIEAYRILSESGSLYLHLDYREVHYCKVLLDQIFGRDNFMNEIIWAYDYGGRPKNRWPAKHDNILFYVKTKGKHIFNFEEIERIPYMAPKLVGDEKAALGKIPTDVWWHTIVPTNSKEKTGYPTQKPLNIIKRIIQASSNPGDIVLDFFAGSGTTGMAAIELQRKFILIDNNPQAIDIMKKRFCGIDKIFFI